MAEKTINKTAAQINLIIGNIAVTEGAGSPNINMGFSGNSIEEGVGSRANVIAGGGYTGSINKITGVESRYATIGGGYDNFLDGTSSTTDLDAASSTIAGGAHNIIKCTHATIGGGSYGTINAASDYSIIGGGTTNTITGAYAVIGGGHTNSVSAESGTISGGRDNIVSGRYSSAVGGKNNNVSGEYSVIGGLNNIASGDGGVALGISCQANAATALALGYDCQVTGDRSVALGYKCYVSGDYAFATGREITVSGNNSMGFALNDQNQANVTQASTMAILGGKVGIDVIAPSAKLHLPAGTATAGTAPLKLTTGVNLTTPESGAVEWDGTNLYVTQADGTRKTIAYTA